MDQKIIKIHSVGNYIQNKNRRRFDTSNFDGSIQKKFRLTQRVKEVWMNMRTVIYVKSKKRCTEEEVHTEEEEVHTEEEEVH